MAYPQVDVRACTPDDLDRLTSGWPVAGGVHESHVARSLDGGSEFLVAWHDDVPLGSAVLLLDGCARPEARRAFPDAVEICHLQVRPGSRGRGIGTELVRVAESRALARGHGRVGVGVADDNPEARRLYERLGYRATGVVDVTEYTWLDEDGTAHEARERDELLVKDLRTV